MRIALPPFDPAQSAAFDAPPPADPSATIPTPIGQHFRQRGLCVWRTGWQRHDVMFSIEAGPYHHVTHNQADKGHFTLYGLGYRWAADVGYGNDRNPDGRCQTTAHSCVLIDGRGQALSGAALGTSGKILRYENTHKSGYALADAKPAYDANNAGQPGVPVRRALRHAFLVRPSGGIPAYAVVLDDIQARAPDADGKNNYTWQMITWADMRVEQPPGHPSTFILTPPGPAGAVPRMVVALAASAPLALGSAPFHPDDTPGRPPYDYRRLRAETRAANPHFAALLAPLPPGAPAPRFTAEGIAGAGDSARIQISITWPDRTDIIEWRDDSATLKPAPGYYP
ncbi:MAG: heparinase II/III-family protein [Opitutaceae bacterium]|nr:heparinase II/III-family protein [Opitutaceae bacterium]